MGDVQANFRQLGQINHLFQRFENVLALVPHMNGDDHIVDIAHFHQRCQLGLVGKQAGHISQTQRHAPDTLLDGLCQQKLRNFDLIFPGRTRQRAHNTVADGIMTDQLHQIGRHGLVAPLFAQLGKSAGLIRPHRGQFSGFLFPFHPVHLTDIAGKAGRTTLAHDFGRHTLVELGFAATVLDEPGVGMGMAVDEGRCNNQTGNIDDFPGFFGDGGGNLHDFSVPNGNVAHEGRRSGSITD